MLLITKDTPTTKRYTPSACNDFNNTYNVTRMGATIW